MLKKILIVLAVAVAVVAFLASRQPDVFHVSRSTTINAPATAVFPQINNLTAMNSWSPWLKLDPAATVTASGPAEGVGAASHWSGNADIGEGTMTITNSLENESVTYRLDFVRPMAGTGTAAITLRPEASGTLVTWSMDSKNNFFAKVISVFMNCEKMVAEQFDNGLANLKTLVESAPAAPAAAPQQ